MGIGAFEMIIMELHRYRTTSKTLREEEAKARQAWAGRGQISEDVTFLDPRRQGEVALRLSM